ncbi:uncharacterized protein (DUF427 family) [Pacificibacter maritimus]|uniref:Uncharacterized protein (DUF427 family) n=1 Tax=Pacificibacter maritimus TaxID=762213 RepID=A0A3N4UMS9_9RHOB|nr:DUF427 domain-containing protein [Pacificibacter maritimus]RPE71912.1 uncharacterized protein (DUF427 family) [Pacificibacter maritimus]
MTDLIKIRPASGTYVVRAGGAVIGESDQALELIEGDAAPVIYFPRASLAMAFLDTSDTKTTCPHKGVASYYSIQTKSVLLKDAAWSYENPKSGLEQIAGHLAFYPNQVAVELL